MNIIIPMAGIGKRFIDAGFNVPKPLIKVGNKPMYHHAVNSLPLYMATRLIFLIRADNSTDLFIKDIKKYYGSIAPCHIVILENSTEGQAETVLKSKQYADKTQPTLVHNCDTKIDSDINWKSLIRYEIDGSLMLFKSKETRWSYAKLNEEETSVIDVQEKNTISPYASTGTYYFKDTDYLFYNINQIIEKKWKEKNEYYFSTIYRLMINEKKRISPLWAKNFFCFGTPADLVNALNKMLIAK